MESLILDLYAEAYRREHERRSRAAQQYLQWRQSRPRPAASPRLVVRWLGDRLVYAGEGLRAWSGAQPAVRLPAP